MTSEPKDLGVKIGSAEERAWTAILKKAVDDNVLCNREIIINEEIVKLAKRKIREEKEKFK